MAMETTSATDPVKQFSIFVENRVGRLFDLVALFTAHNVHIIGMTILDTSDTAIDRVVVDDPDRARELLAANNFAFSEHDVVAVEFADESQLKHILAAFVAVECNIYYTYSFLMRPEGKCGLIFSCEDNDLATSSLNSRGFKTLTQRDIAR